MTMDEAPQLVEYAGKTGTAQVRNKRREPEHVKGWHPHRHHAWFAGYAPADNPKIAVAAIVEHGGVGADAAAPIVMHVIDTYLASLEQLKPDQARPRRPAGVPPPLPGQRRPNDGVSNRPEYDEKTDPAVPTTEEKGR